MNDALVMWVGGALLQWAACLAISLPVIVVSLTACRIPSGHASRLIWLALFFYACLLLARSDQFIHWIPWPWQGMTFITLLAAGVMFGTRTWSANGLNWRIGSTAWRDAAIVSGVLLVFVALRKYGLLKLGLTEAAPGFSLENLIFQLTMPGIAEELAYRGVIQSQLNRVFPQPWKVLGVPVGWGFVITAVAFWAIHAFQVNELMLSFHWQTVTLSLVAGAVFGWLRERTNSLLPAIITHNLVNVVGILI